MVEQTNTPANLTQAGQIMVLEEGRVIRLDAPTIAGQEAAVDASMAQTIQVQFSPDIANVQVVGNDLMFQFENGSATILRNFTAQDPMPQIIMPDGTVVAGNIVVAQILSNEDVIDFETAAGPGGGAQGSGVSSYSDDLGESLDLLNPGGLLDFSDPFFEPEEDEEFLGIAPQNAGGPVIAGNTNVQIPESVLQNGSGTLNGSLNIINLPGSGGIITALPNFTATGSLFNGTFQTGGEAITVTINNNVFTGTTTSGTTVFTMQINQDGTYNFELFEPLDHGDPNNPVDVIDLNFTYVIDLPNGDQTTGTVSVGVIDHSPILSDAQNTFDESNPAVVSGQINATFGADGPATTDPIRAGDGAGNSVWTSNLVGDVPRSNGVPVVITLENGSYVGRAGGDLVFTLQINPNGSYTYTQVKGLDHVQGDTLQLNFAYSAVDFDGDSTTRNLTINVLDSVPTATATNNIVSEGTDIGAVVSGTLTVQPGMDEIVSTTMTVNFTATGSLAGGQLTSGGVPIVVTFNPTANSYTGTAGAATVFTFVLNPNGTYAFSLLQPIDHADTNNPSDIINLNFPYEVADADGDTATGTIRIDVRDHGPLAVNDVLNGAVTNNGVVTFNGNILTNDSFGADGEGNIVTFGGQSIPAGGLTLVGQYGTIVVQQDGSYIYTLTTPQPAVNGGPVSYNEVWGYVIQDRDGDRSTANLNVNITENRFNPVPTITGSNVVISEQGLVTSKSVSGSVTVDWNGDDVGAVVQGDGTSNLNGMTSAGVPVTVSFNPATNVYTGTANGVTVFTMTINANGTYTFTQFKAIDHANTSNPNDPFNITFGVRAVNGSGDTANATVGVTILDDGPSVMPAIIIVDETNQLGQTFNGTISVSGGADGLASFGANGTFSVDGQTGLTSGGVPVTVTVQGSNYIGMAGGVQVFSLTLQSNGAYSFVQNQPLDHPNANDPNDALVLRFGIRATDGDGDTASATISVSVLDDGPTAVNDVLTGTVTDAGAMTFTGNILTNDSFGTDGAGGIVSFAGQAIPVGGLTVTGQYGTIVIQQNGSYVYTVTAPKPTAGAQTYAENWSYTIRDFDGDRSTANLNVTITDNRTNDVPIVTNSAVTIDETGLVTSKSVAGQVSVNWGADAAGAKVEGLGTSNLNGLTSNGQPISVAFNPTTNSYTGTANGVTVFTLAINANGSYNFTQFKPVDHPNMLDPNDAFNITFGIKATDGDGDTANGVITVTILDDGPTAVNDVVNATVTDGSPVVFTGNILSNDSFGADGAGSIISFGGQSIPAGGLTLAGQYGTIVLQQNGSFVYTLTAPKPPANGGTAAYSDSWSYTIRDFDGDRSTANLTLNINDSRTNDVPIITNSAVTIDETGLVTSKSVSGQVSVNWGADAAGAKVEGLGTTNLNGLTSKGQPITVAFNATTNTYTGTAGGSTVFTLKVNANGSYTFTQVKPVDHPNPNNANDAFNITFGIKATDGDGDTANGLITVTILDDGPTAVNDVVNGTVTNNSPVVFNGNILSNDTFGADGQGGIVTFGGQAIPAAGLQLAGQYGTIVIQQNGSFVYTLTAPKPAASLGGQMYNENWSYTIRDFDGDRSTATLTLNIQDGRTNDVPIVTNSSVIIDETGLVTSKSVSGQVSVNWGADAAGAKVEGINSFNMNGMKANGVPVNVVFNAATNTFTGTANGTTVFTMKINANGSYTFTQFKGIDHANMLDPNDAFNITFGIKATDGDGDTANGQITVTILDDGPIANNDTNLGNLAQGQQELTLTGNILANDSFGADVAGGRILSFGGVQMPTDGSPLTFQGQYGIFTLHANGNYTYFVKADGSTMAGSGGMSGWPTNLPSGFNDLFGTWDSQRLDGDPNAGGTNGFFQQLPDQLMESISYTIRDGDGDRAIAVLTVTVNNFNGNPGIQGNTALGGGSLFDSGVFANASAEGQSAPSNKSSSLFEPDIIQDYNYQQGDVIDLSHLLSSGTMNANTINNFVQYDAGSNALYVSETGDQGSYSKAVELPSYNGSAVKIMVGDSLYDIGSTSHSPDQSNFFAMFDEISKDVF